MKVKVIAVTKPVIEEIEDIKELIAYCARVSNPSNQANTTTMDKLIDYLIQYKHFSPFEMGNIVLEISTTRDIARQILRHRSFSFQEFSQRYASPKVEEFVLREARLQDTKNRQNSIEINDPELQAKWDEQQKEVLNKSLAAYQWAIDNGIAKEQARAVLPEGLTPSVMYMNGTVRSWIHYLEVRRGIETQKEHREIAIAIAEAINEWFPV